MYKVFTILKNIYKFRNTLKKKMKYLLVIKLFLFFKIMWYHMVPLGGNGLIIINISNQIKTSNDCSYKILLSKFSIILKNKFDVQYYFCINEDYQ